MFGVPHQTTSGLHPCVIDADIDAEDQAGLDPQKGQ
jgi:hypothetical protein